MKILKRQQMLWRIRIESEDDLWAISRLARKGSSIAMLGERRDQTTAGETGGRAKSAERKKMWIKLRIENSEYQTFSETLRIHGIIEESKIDIGLYHTHIVEIMDEIEITSLTPFDATDVELLKQSEKASKAAQVALLVVENDEMILYFVTGRGLRESAMWTMRGGGKRGDLKTTSSVASSFRKSVIFAITAQLNEDIPLILCGPGHAKDILLPELRDSGHSRFIKLVATSMGGRSAANEVLSEGLAEDLLGEHAISKEILLLEEAWTRLSTTGTVAYGKEQLNRALTEGAIETLLITADLLRDEEDTIAGKTWPVWCRGLSDISAELIQCSTDHDSGLQLLGMGGVVALLRYKL